MELPSPLDKINEEEELQLQQGQLKIVMNDISEISDLSVISEKNIIKKEKIQ